MAKIINLLIWLAPHVALAQGPITADLQFAFKGDADQVADILGLDRKAAKKRQVFLFDTYALDLFHRNIQIRLRLSKDRAQVAVKRWGLSTEEFYHLNAELGECEVDVHGPVIVRSCAVKTLISTDEAEKITSGHPVLRVLDDKQIRLLITTQAPLETLENLIALGPLESTTWSWQGRDGEKFNVDFQGSLDNRLFRELSVKTESEDFVSHWVNVHADLKKRGLRLARETKWPTA